MTKKQPTSKLPEWAEGTKEAGFASAVIDGVEGGHDGLGTAPKVAHKTYTPRKQLSVDDYVQGVIDENRTILAQAITLIESNAPRHKEIAQGVLQKLLNRTGRSIRIGITGVPGAGKSTFIEAFGTMLCQAGHKVAVLAVDPSSSISKGSILGDKTRMEKLSIHPNSFIRPSPSGGTLGGVARKSRETMLLCEATNYDVILVETVGVGQSEATVRSMVDFFLLLTITGAGDELQSIKKGVIELSDAIVINKADGDNFIPAQRLRSEFEQALHFLTPCSKGWQTKALSCSALTSDGISSIWETVKEFTHIAKTSGEFDRRRKAQLFEWIDAMVIDQLKNQFYSDAAVQAKLPLIQDAVISGELPATVAAEQLLKAFEK